MVLVPGKSRKNYLPVDTNDPVKAEEIEESQPYVSVVNEGSPSPDTQASYPDGDAKSSRLNRLFWAFFYKTWFCWFVCFAVAVIFYIGYSNIPPEDFEPYMIIERPDGTTYAQAWRKQS